ncbi:MAG: hypothetical protein ABEH58_09400 [Haloplanus sp.]
MATRRPRIGDPVIEAGKHAVERTGDLRTLPAATPDENDDPCVSVVMPEFETAD